TESLHRLRQGVDGTARRAHRHCLGAGPFGLSVLQNAARAAIPFDIRNGRNPDGIPKDTVQIQATFIASAPSWSPVAHLLDFRWVLLLFSSQSLRDQQ